MVDRAEGISSFGFALGIGLTRPGHEATADEARTVAEPNPGAECPRERRVDPRHQGIGALDLVGDLREDELDLAADEDQDEDHADGQER